MKPRQEYTPLWPSVRGQLTSAVMAVLVAALTMLGIASSASAQDDGRVEISLAEYQALLAAVQADGTGRWAISSASITFAVADTDTTPRTTVTANVDVRVFEDGTTLVPVLPAGTTIRSATVAGQPAALTPTPAGVAWIADRTGSSTLTVTYDVVGEAFSDGSTIAVPVPPAASVTLNASVPGEPEHVSVIPATTINRSAAGATTSIYTTLPATTGVQVSWRGSGSSGATSISRADYVGTQTDDAIQWTATFVVDHESGGRAQVPLVDQDLALRSVTVDGTDAPISVQNRRFTVPVNGAGRHTIVAEFQTPVDRSAGPPQVRFPVPTVPISRVEVTMPGDKELQVTPAGAVERTVTEDTTTSIAFVRMTDSLTLSWSEAVPEEAEEIEVRANASIFHTAHAEEGVLYVHATAQYEITRGESSQFTLEVPDPGMINRITTSAAIVSDWRMNEASAEVPRSVTIFLDRQLSGLVTFEIDYEVLLGGGEDARQPVSVPLLYANDVSRQRGMIALLSNQELTLEPTVEEGLNRVGENQLPPEIRGRIDQTVAHTFRYFEARPNLVVQPQEPERREGRFDAQVNTLVSLGDVTTRVNSRISIDIKQGSIMNLRLGLPGDVNLLSFSAPSMRDYEVVDEDGGQVIEVAFTQELEGDVRIDLSFERIHSDAGGTQNVPFVAVEGAEIEEGLIAVQALSAVEVQAGEMVNLSNVDLSELPDQLIRQTTNPILLAFKYVQADPRPALELAVTQHMEINVQAAIIDSAHYETVVLNDGFAMTMARYVVRNTDQQFLRVALPAGSEVLAATVNGQSGSPALANQDDENAPPEVLINIINSTEGFEVVLFYSTPVPEFGLFGRVRGELPRPDMIVTSTTWDVYVPEEFIYGEPDTDMRVVAANETYYGDEMAMNQALGGSLNFDLPREGVLFSFEKLYANQSEDAVSFALPYRAESAGNVGKIARTAGVLLFWLSLFGLLRGVSKSMGAAGMVLGVAGIAVGVMMLGADFDGVYTPSFIAIFLGAMWLVAPWILKRLRSRDGVGSGDNSTPARGANASERKATPAPDASPSLQSGSSAGPAEAMTVLAAAASEIQGEVESDERTTGAEMDDTDGRGEAGSREVPEASSDDEGETDNVADDESESDAKTDEDDERE